MSQVMDRTRSPFSCISSALQYHLVPNHADGYKAQVSTTSREYGHEKEPFRKLLCAMYNRPYQIKNTGELKILANLADFYCALPIVSATLTAAMLGSPMVKREINPGGPIGHEISDNSVELIIVAKKLRHAVLYRECFIHLVGLWPPGHPDLLSQPEIDLLKRDKRLWRLLSDGYANLNQRILKVHHKLLNLVLRRTISFHALVELLPGRLMTDPQESADAFRTLRIELAKLRAEVNMSGNVNLEELSTLVDDLMVNNLVLDQTGYDVGEGPFETIFLCADIGDEVMPWDSEETDY